MGMDQSALFLRQARKIPHELRHVEVHRRGACPYPRYRSVRRVVEFGKGIRAGSHNRVRAFDHLVRIQAQNRFNFNRKISLHNGHAAPVSMEAQRKRRFIQVCIFMHSHHKQASHVPSFKEINAS